MKLNFLFIVLVLATFISHGESIFFEGTYAGDMRYNVHKIGVIDSQLCWCAAASNSLQLWQDRIIESGTQIPSSIPCGKTQTQYSTDIFAIFVSEWTNAPYWEENAFSWWINGTIVNPSSSSMASQLTGVGSGGYWSFLGVKDTDISEYIKSDGKYEWLLDTIIEADIGDFLLTCGVYASGVSHASNIWGCEYDKETYSLKGLWMSDSDLSKIEGNFYVPVIWNVSKKVWEFNTVDIPELISINGFYIGDVTIFDASGLLYAVIPEVCESAFFVGIFSIFAILIKRKE